MTARGRQDRAAWEGSLVDGEIPTLAIVGGGLTGAVVAHQVARRAPGALRIRLIEPRPRLGAGVAYSTPDPAHRINVPASRMSFVQSDPCHFDRWLKADGALKNDREALTPDGRAFPQRAVFGRYAAETIEPFIASGAIEHERARAISLQPTPDGRWAITLADGDGFFADYVVLAATHPAPTPPQAFAHVLHDPRVITDAQRTGALEAIAPDARVLIVGTGLTMADIVASLDARGHRGRIVSVSRRGLLSRGHPETAGAEIGAFATPPIRTARELVRRIRRTVAAAAAVGEPWQRVLDAVRAQGGAIWANLTEAERIKVVRRLRPFWDVHRFRVAPQVEQVTTRRRSEGSLEVFVGEPIAAESAEEAISVTIRTRRGTEVRDFDAVALATGPGHRGLVDTDPLISGLARVGVVALDRVGLGLATNAQSRAIGTNGAASETFWIAGPLARGAVGELMGLPEVARHAEFVAGEVAKTAAGQSRSAREVA